MKEFEQEKEQILEERENLLHFDEDLIVKIENEISNKKNKFEKKY